MKKTRVTITIKKDVRDPAGIAVKNTLSRLGMVGLLDVRIGKVVDLTFQEGKAGFLDVENVAQSILSNPLMEDFTVSMMDDGHEQ